VTRTLAFCFGLAFVTTPVAQTARPVTYRVIALAEPGRTLHQGFVDVAMDWLQKKGAEEGFAVDYIRTTDPINEQFLAAHAVFIQLNYPPYRWTSVAEAAFKKAMTQGTIGWIGFHHASLLGRFDGFEMSPFFHEFMGNIVFKSYIPDFATATVHVEASAHPVLKGLPQTFPIENDEWYTYDRSPRPDVQVLANVDENSYEPARTVKMGDHPVIWTNPHYKARNVYFQFGHKGALLQNPYFTQVFLNSIHWASGHSPRAVRIRGYAASARQPSPLRRGRVSTAPGRDVLLHRSRFRQKAAGAMTRRRSWTLAAAWVFCARTREWR
jgi:type 1 glutamine amidotransferase